MKNSKKVLILTYYWPPSGGSGVQRWMYFAKYLRYLGWTPFVITVDEKYASYSTFDQTLLKEVDGINVTKTKTREPLKWYSLFFTGSKNRGIPQGEFKIKGFLSRFAAFIRGNYFLPDARKGWNTYAFIEAVKLIKKENVKTVITTGPPHSTHLVGAKLKSKFAIKWLADFRDPWSDIFYNKDFYQTKSAKKRNNDYEKMVLNFADAIMTTVSGQFQNKLKKKAPDQKFFTFPNGYDHILLSKTPKTQFNSFHIVYTGLLTDNQDYIGLIKVLKTLSKNNIIRFSLAGQIPKSILNYIRTELPLAEVNYKGYISHVNALNLIKSADLLLNFIFKTAYHDMISGKLMEYLATEIPVLSIGNPNSEAGKLLREGSFAEMIQGHNEKAIQNFISKTINQKGKALNKVSGIEKWSRMEITKDLIKLISKHNI